MPTLEILSINIWTILISLANLLIIFIILKKVLWKPVKKAMEQRQAMVDKQFADAAAADETARRHGDRIVADAKDKAAGIIRQAEAEAELERQKATASIKEEIAAVSAELAEKLLEREVNTADHAKMIESFLDEVGDAT